MAELLPGGIDGLAYADTMTIRLPLDVALTEQSQRSAVLGLLKADVRGEGEPTGFNPVEADNTIVVSFVTCVVHCVRH
jgi:hypothetical protein